MIANQGISISAAAPAPETIRLGSIVLRILPRPPDVAGTAERASSGANENSRSLGVRVEYGSFSALITGDSQKDTYKWWQENIAPSLFANATILKLAHHGSVSGTDADWLGIVKPQAAVVSMGLDVIWQRWSMPAPSVTALLKERRIKLHNTALSGSIGIQTDGQSWQVFMGGRAPGRPPSPREVVFVGVQYAVACVYVGLIAWRCTKYRETWRRLVTDPIVSVGAGAIVLVLYGVLGSTFGLPDLFWHDEWAIQLLAGLSVMWLTLFLAALTADGWRETLATREHIDGPTRAGVPLVLMVLPAALLPVFNSGAGHPLAAALDRSWLVAGMLVGLLVVRAAVEIVARRTALTTLSLGSRTTVAVVAAAVIVPIALALADRRSTSSGSEHLPAHRPAGVCTVPDEAKAFDRVHRGGDTAGLDGVHEWT